MGKKKTSIFITFVIYGQLLKLSKEEKKKGGKCAHTHNVLPPLGFISSNGIQ